MPFPFEAFLYGNHLHSGGRHLPGKPLTKTTVNLFFKLQSNQRAYFRTSSGQPFDLSTDFRKVDLSLTEFLHAMFCDCIFTQL